MWHKRLTANVAQVSGDSPQAPTCAQTTYTPCPSRVSGFCYELNLGPTDNSAGTWPPHNEDVAAAKCDRHKESGRGDLDIWEQQACKWTIVR